MSASAQTKVTRVANYSGGQWKQPAASEWLPVLNPATNDPLAEVPLSAEPDVTAAIEAAAAAFPEWRRTPPEERIQYLFQLKQLLEEHLEELARTITLENGKTLAESRGELRRAIENDPFTVEDARIRRTVSIGLAMWPDDGREPAAVLSSADRALYAAKQAGRNRVVAASSLPPAAPPVPQ